VGKADKKCGKSRPPHRFARKGKRIKLNREKHVLKEDSSTVAAFNFEKGQDLHRTTVKMGAKGTSILAEEKKFSSILRSD